MRNITNNRRLTLHIDAANERTASRAVERGPQGALWPTKLLIWSAKLLPYHLSMAPTRSSSPELGVHDGT